MSHLTFNCLYCGIDKPLNETSLEHAIPQFMGGSSAPSHFELSSNVCKKCNNSLGLFVDASYAKSAFVTNILAEAARSLCTSVTDPGLPLRYVGNLQLPDLRVPEGELAEYWLGPFGESIIWIRPHDERMDSYAGGNPIDAKKKPSVAYLFPVSSDPLIVDLGIRSFHKAYNKKNIRKILCAKILDLQGDAVSPDLLSFDMPDNDDLYNWQIILKAIVAGKMPNRILINTKFDYRFICKIALGVGYALFGDDYLASDACAEARKGVWPRRDGPVSEIRAASTLVIENSNVASMAGYQGAVAVTVMNTGARWVLTLSINQKIPFVVDLGPSSMESSFVSREEGYTLLLFPYLDKAFEFTTATIFAHRSGHMISPELQKIDDALVLATSFNAQLVL